MDNSDNTNNKNQRWNNFKDYVKCAYANKATFAGYLGMIGTGILFCNGSPENHELLPLYILATSELPLISIGLLGSTAFGIATLDSYRDTKTFIEKEGTMDKRFYNKHRHYCNRVGIRLAAREAGLEDKLD